MALHSPLHSFQARDVFMLVTEFMWYQSSSNTTKINELERNLYGSCCSSCLSPRSPHGRSGRGGEAVLVHLSPRVDQHQGQAQRPRRQAQYPFTLTYLTKCRSSVLLDITIRNRTGHKNITFWRTYQASATLPTVKTVLRAAQVA